MDTQEKTRRRPARRPNTRRRSAGGDRNGQKRRRTGETRSRDARPARENVRRRRQETQPVSHQTEPVLEVRFTMPKPFSKGGFLLKLASVAAVVAAVVMCLSLFFRVEEVVVSGADKYTPWMVKEASGLEYGDSLLSVSDARVAGKIRLALPYVDEVRVGIKLPGTVYIEITELETTYAIQARDETWWLIAADGRVVEQITATAATGYTRIQGVRADGPRTDQRVQAAESAVQTTEATVETGEDGMTLPTTAQITNAQRLDAVLTILQALEDNGVIGQIASIDVTNLNDITMEYGQRLHIVLGTSENLAYKVSYMAAAIEQLEEYETGELDVSFKWSEKALLNPESGD